MMLNKEASKVEKLYMKYNKIMYNVAYNILHDFQLAQDAVQMSFVKIIENIEKIDEIECNKTEAFVVIICRNISINIYNKRKKNPPITLEEVEEVSTQSKDTEIDPIIAMENICLLKEKMKLLPKHYADIIALRYTYEYSEKEIAKMLDITTQNVGVRLHRARNSLLKLLQQEKEAEIG